MTTLLGRIVDSKREEVESAKRSKPIEEMKETAAARGAARGFSRALTSGRGTRIIAELKKASPTRGLLRPDFDPAALAKQYAGNGAAAFSVLTESRFFMGDLAYIAVARAAGDLPALRKDFIMDPYQIYESRAAEADALLLIAAALERALLADLLALTHNLGMEALVEVHDERELESVLQLPCDVVGVNNRNLKDGTVDIETSIRIAPMMKNSACKISESGIKNRSDIARLSEAGYNGFLIGETLVAKPDPGLALRELIGPNGDKR